jgi:hypothetical protein
MLAQPLSIKTIAMETTDNRSRMISPDCWFGNNFNGADKRHRIAL